MAEPDDELAHVRIAGADDVSAARQAVKAVARQIGFAGSDLTLIATAVVEIARNIVSYAGQGDISMRAVKHGHRGGLAIIARDNGPGILDLNLALPDDSSSAQTLSTGLPAARRLMDEFDIQSSADCGSTVIMTKWIR